MRCTRAPTLPHARTHARSEISILWSSIIYIRKVYAPAVDVAAWQRGARARACVPIMSGAIRSQSSLYDIVLDARKHTHTGGPETLADAVAGRMCEGADISRSVRVIRSRRCRHANR